MHLFYAKNRKQLFLFFCAVNYINNFKILFTVHFNQISFFSLNAEEAWIGMIVTVNETGFGSYSWTDNSTVLFNNLDPNLTLNANEKYCVAFVFKGKFWKVADCNEKKLFLCSIPNSSKFFAHLFRDRRVKKKFLILLSIFTYSDRAGYS